MWILFTSFFRNISGPEPAANSNFKGALPLLAYRLGGQKNITVEVNNVLVNSKIHNIFGVIKGFTDPGTVCLEDVILSWKLILCLMSHHFGSADRYVVLGAQRDTWGEGYAKATVGTSVLVELAKAIREMVEKGNDYKFRHSCLPQ